MFKNQFEKILKAENSSKSLKLVLVAEVSIANYWFKFHEFWPIFAI